MNARSASDAKTCMKQYKPPMHFKLRKETKNNFGDDRSAQKWSNTFWIQVVESCLLSLFFSMYPMRRRHVNSCSGPLQLLVCSKKTQALLVLGHPNPKTSSAGRWTTSTCCGHHGSFIVRKGEGRPPQKKTQGPKFKNKKCQFGNWLYLYTYNYILMLFVLKLDIHVKRPLVLASVHKKPTKNVVDFSGRFGHKITSPVAPSNNKYVLKCFSKLILYWRKSVL